MENLLQIVFILALVKYSCKAAFIRNYLGIMLFPLIAGVFAFAVYPVVVRNSVQIFTSFFSEKEKITNLAIIITVEAVSGIMLSTAVTQNLIPGKKHKNGLAILRLLPGVIIVGAIFYTELKAFYYFPGVSFWLTALIISAGVFLLVGIVSLSIRFFLPDERMLCELKFFTNIFLFITAVVLNAGLADYNRGSYHSELALPGLVVFLLLVTGLGFTGYFIQRIKNKGKLKKLYKWI